MVFARFRSSTRPTLRLSLLALAEVALALSVVSIATGCVPKAEQARLLPGQGDDLGKVVLYRDTWGVAHIYAPTVEGGLYAQGWAQAQDRPEQLLVNLMMAIGEYSRVVGEGGIEVDVRSRLFDHYGVAQRAWPSLRPELESHLRAFAAGMNDYYDQHPDDRPAWFSGRSVDGAMIVAFSRLFLYNWSIDEAYGDLKRGGVEPGFEPAQRGSNQFAVAPSRSAEGAAILAIDPHLSWYGPSRFWEMRFHAGALEGSGVTLPGSPYIGLGHTRYLAWAMTTGGPDTADIYELRLDSPDGTRYLFDGEWRELESRTVEIEVAGRDAAEKRTLWYSHHGPIVARQGDRAWAAKTSYADVADVNEAWWQLNFGKSYQGAVEAMATQTMFPQNVMVADTAGNIYYQRSGRVPKRPEGLDWSRPVDGTTSTSEWLGIHPSSDHLQVLNPPQGYMQNCNIPPDAMMRDSPFELDQSVPYLFSSREYGAQRCCWTSQRGARAVELLEGDTSVTVEEAKSYINDIHPYGADRWLEALRIADASYGARLGRHEHYRAALDELLAWDGQLETTSTAALKYDYWRNELQQDHASMMAAMTPRIDDFYAVVEGREPAPVEVADEHRKVMVTAFSDALAELERDFGSIDVAYGQRYRVGRGEESWPLAGGGGRIGTTTLRNVGYGPEADDATRRGRSGQTSTQVVLLSEPPQSWIYLPLGQSDREDSPHFDDQAERAFSPRQLKDSWWLPEQLVDHIESRTVLEGAPQSRASGGGARP